MKKQKPIHLTVIRYGCDCTAACSEYIGAEPIDIDIIKKYRRRGSPKGTFDPRKVTCKRCLKHPYYKEVLDRMKNPLFYWKENAT